MAAHLPGRGARAVHRGVESGKAVMEYATLNSALGERRGTAALCQLRILPTLRHSARATAPSGRGGARRKITF
ncbi:hypothetical protein SKAU_G00390860 [Synaphobranchus kaupii]|uniref:Uncharacterized protein n=1 Tax=Synaphobranchus kaupii TaxID=118154 RepID=A0A9Q1IDL2_SYNKA|nr:hypothetical protein SKAU_G00390860 [Synaphobranchus kaupii]